MSKLLERLLGPDIPDLRTELPTRRVRVTRLSKLTGEDWVVTLRALPYGRVEDIKKSNDDIGLQILLAGMADPDPKDEALTRRYEAVTPAEALKALFLPGEIEDLAREVELLTGYRQSTIETVKNASGAEAMES